MTLDPLRVDSILKRMADALPTHAKDDMASDLSSSYEAISLFCHGCMIAVGFRLLGFGEDRKMEAECQRLAPRLLPQWNSSFGSHSFLYAHPQSSMQFVLKVDRLGGKAEVRGMGLGDERISRFEVTAKDYVSPSALPLRIPLTPDGTEDRSGLPAKLKEVLISESRIKDLASLFKVSIIQKLIPNLHKEGYEEAITEPGAAERERVQDMREDEHGRRRPQPGAPRGDFLPQPARPHPFDDPLAGPPPRGPTGEFPPPGFEDEYDMYRPRGGGYTEPGAFPLGIGHDDLYPPGLGPHDPLRGSFVGGGLLRPRGAPGMHPTFDDPLFADRGGQTGSYSPRAPPGARYDPVGPGDQPQRGSSQRFSGGNGPGGSGWRPPNPFGEFGDGDFV